MQSDAGSAVVVVEDKSSCPTSLILQLVDVLLGVWILHRAGVLQYGSDQGLAGSPLQFSCPSPRVPSQEARSSICFGANVVCMLIPTLTLVDGDSQVFGPR